MSRLTEVYISELKGTAKKFELAPVTLIHGPNRSNKTSIVDAIQIAILGYHPGQPKNNAGVMNLASGPVMEVGVKFESGESVARTYKLTGTGATSTVNPKGYELDPRLALCMDPSLYFGKTDTERVQRVIELSEGLGSAERVPGIIARLKMLKATAHSAEAEQALQELISAMPQFSRNLTVQVWLSNLLEWAKDQQKIVNATVKAFEQTNRTLTEANSIDTLNNIADVQAHKAKLKELNDEIQRLNQEWGRARAEAAQTEKDQRRIQQLDAEIATLSQTTTKGEQLDAWSEEITRLTQVRDNTRASAVETEKRLKPLLDELDTLAKNRRPLSDELAKLRGNGQALVRQIGEAQKKISEIESLACCPYCKASQHGWKAELERAYNAERSGYSNSLGEVNAKIAEIQKKIDEIDAKTAEIDAAENTLDTQRQELDRKVDEYTQEIHSLERQVAASTKNVQRLLYLQEERKKYPDVIEIPSVVEPQDLPEVRREAFEVEAQIQIFHNQEAERARIAQVQSEGVKARAKLELTKGLLDAVKDEQAKLVNEAFEPVLGIANAFLSGIIETPLRYHEGMVGRLNPANGKFIPVSTFSGSEQRATFAAVSAALAVGSPHRIAIIDEIGTFDDVTRTCLVRNAVDLVKAGAVDQVLFVGTTPPPSLPAEVMVIYTGS